MPGIEHLLMPQLSTDGLRLTMRYRCLIRCHTVSQVSNYQNTSQGLAFSASAVKRIEFTHRTISDLSSDKGNQSGFFFFGVRA